MPTLRQQDISKLVFVKEFQINCGIISYSQDHFRRNSHPQDTCKCVAHLVQRIFGFLPDDIGSNLIPNNVSEKQLIEVMYIDIQFYRCPHCFEHKLIVAIASHDEHVNILIITIGTKRLLVTMAIPH